jgi:hypothetical protein
LRKCGELLARRGRIVLQAITIDDRQYAAASSSVRWPTCRSCSMIALPRSGAAGAPPRAPHPSCRCRANRSGRGREFQRPADQKHSSDGLHAACIALPSSAPSDHPRTL